MMKKLCISLYIILAVILTACSTLRPNIQPPPQLPPAMPDYSEGHEPVDVGKRIAANVISIFNNSNTDLTIILKHKSEADTVKILAYTRWMNGMPEAEAIAVVKTGATSVLYRLALGNEYMLYWNEKGKRWDMGRVTLG